MFALAHAEDVEKGGRYDARSAAINIYTHSWTTPWDRNETTIMGTLYCAWADENRICKIELDEGFSLEDLLTELGTLEAKAFGRKIHGR